MESPTAHYQKLRDNVNHARKIVARVDQEECRSDLQHLKLRSYVLLCHSIVEEFIEDLGLDVALEARRLFANNEIITRSLVALVTSQVLFEIKEKSRAKIGSDLVRNLDTFSEEAFTTYRNSVTSNNGIQPDDLKRVFVPIGFDPESVDLSLVNSMKALGEKRGGLAHKFAIQQELTLSAFETDLNSIIRDLEVFDKEACGNLAVRMAQLPV